MFDVTKYMRAFEAARHDVPSFHTILISNSSSHLDMFAEVYVVLQKDCLLKCETVDLGHGPYQRAAERPRLRTERSTPRPEYSRLMLSRNISSGFIYLLIVTSCLLFTTSKSYEKISVMTMWHTRCPGTWENVKICISILMLHPGSD